MRSELLFLVAIVAALLGLPAMAADPVVDAIPQAAYSVDTAFGPFNLPAGADGAYLILDVDSLTGTTPTWRICLSAIETNVGGSVAGGRVECNSAVSDTGSVVLHIGRIVSDGSVVAGSNVVASLPSRFFLELVLGGTNPVWTGEANLSFSSSPGN